MSKTSFRCRLVTPEAEVFDEQAVAAVLPAHDGSVGVLPQRAPLVATLGLGEFRVDFARHESGAEGGSRWFVIDGGFAQMVGDELTILARKAIPAEALSESDAQAELSEAEARRTEGLTPDEAARVRHDKLQAQTKLRLAKAMRSRGI